MPRYHKFIIRLIYITSRADTHNTTGIHGLKGIMLLTPQVHLLPESVYFLLTEGNQTRLYTSQKCVNVGVTLPVYTFITHRLMFHANFQQLFKKLFFSGSF